MKIKHSAAVITAAIAAALAVPAVAIAAIAGGTVAVPSSGGQLTGTVWECVNSANEGQTYVELGHPAPGNCAPGWLQFTANQPASSPSAPAALVNSETFNATGTSSTSQGGTTVCTAPAPGSFCVSLPAGDHLAGKPAVTDQPASGSVVTAPVATVTGYDAVTGKVNVTWSATPAAADTIEITYDYSL